MSTKLLNGRANPRKTAFVESRFDQGDALELTGEWSEDHRWVEVIGGETGTVWVCIDYISERKTAYKVKNVRYNKVKIRSRPVNGRVIGYLKKGKTTEITREIMGWGKCARGWVELWYLEEEDDDL